MNHNDTCCCKYCFISKTSNNSNNHKLVRYISLNVFFFLASMLCVIFGLYLL